MFMFKLRTDETLISSEFLDTRDVVWRNNDPDLVEGVRPCSVVWPCVAMRCMYSTWIDSTTEISQPLISSLSTPRFAGVTGLWATNSHTRWSAKAGGSCRSAANLLPRMRKQHQSPPAEVERRRTFKLARLLHFLPNRFHCWSAPNAVTSRRLFPQRASIAYHRPYASSFLARPWRRRSKYCKYVRWNVWSNIFTSWG